MIYVYVRWQSLPGLQQFTIAENSTDSQGRDEVPASKKTRCYFSGGWFDTPIYHLEKLGAGLCLQGPAILMQDTSTILVEPGCSAEITEYGDVVLSVKTKTYREIGTQADPVQVSIFGNLFMSIAEQMGRTLQRTAISTNIKERLDFSCAIFDETGGLVANAPHQPVHLGAMSEAVRQQVKLQENNLQEGDVLLTNHPIAGGSHLPRHYSHYSGLEKSFKVSKFQSFREGRKTKRGEDNFLHCQ